MKERPIVFGQDSRLVGVLTEAAGADRGTQRTACIFVNAGLVHRVGPNRLYVRLARELAALGCPSLRFDLSNRGDSAARRDGLAFLEGGLDDVRAAMEVLSRTVQAERFVLMGICSGAVTALYAATRDPRVAGAIAIDGPVYKTPGYYLRYYTRRLAKGQTWKNALTGRNTIGRLLARSRRHPAAPRAEDEFAHLYDDVAVPTREESSKALRALVDRGTKLLFIYTGSWSIYNYENQFRDAFPELMKGGAIRVVYAPDADHTFTRLHHQERLLGIVGGWFGDVFGRAAGDPDVADRDRAAAAR